MTKGGGGIIGRMRWIPVVLVALASCSKGAAPVASSQPATSAVPLQTSSVAKGNLMVAGQGPTEVSGRGPFVVARYLPS